MNIAELSSTAATPGTAIAFWIIAAIIVIGGVVNYMIHRRDEVDGAILISCVITAGALCFIGWDQVGTASREAQDKSFHQELKDRYGWTTNRTLADVKANATRTGIVSFSNGSELVDVRPALDGDVLSFYSAGDNKLVKPAGRG